MKDRLITQMPTEKAGIESLATRMDAIKNISVMVSGLPRTGTSTMMRMLEAGGIPILADEKTINSDGQHNPYGFYELKDVGNWLQASKPSDTNGKAMKLVAPYLHFTPMDREWRVIFMVRDINEVITSLLAMRTVWKYTPDAILDMARKFLDYNRLLVRYVKYHDMVKYPKSTVIGLSDFLGVELDIEKASKVVDPKARSRKSKKTIYGPREIITFEAGVIMEDPTDDDDAKPAILGHGPPIHADTIYNENLEMARGV